MIIKIKLCDRDGVMRRKKLGRMHDRKKKEIKKENNGHAKENTPKHGYGERSGQERRGANLAKAWKKEEQPE